MSDKQLNLFATQEQIEEQRSLPETWAKCNDHQKELVEQMCFNFAKSSGLTEPNAWQTKVKMWLNPLVHIMNASGWSVEGLRRATRVVDNVIARLISERIEIASVRTVMKFACNEIAVAPFVPSDFPHLTDAEFYALMDKQLNVHSKPDDDAIPAQKLEEAREFYDSLVGNTFEEKMESFEQLVFGDDDDEI